MDPAYIEKIQEWIRCDNILQRIKEETNEAIDRKKKVEEEILTYVQVNNLQSLNINVSDGNIKFGSITSKTPLSMKTLKQLMEKFSKDKHPLSADLIEQIIKFISENQESKTKSFIKRDIKIS